jgi:hypothetical protein
MFITRLPIMILSGNESSGETMPMDYKHKAVLTNVVSGFKLRDTVTITQIVNDRYAN